MFEIIAIIIFLVGFVGMSVIIIRKMPALADFSLEVAKDPGIFSKLKKGSGLVARKTFSKTKTKTKDYIAKLSSRSLQGKDKFSDDLIRFLNKNKISSNKIGNFESSEKGLRIKEEKGTINSLNYSETDDITKIF